MKYFNMVIPILLHSLKLLCQTFKEMHVPEKALIMLIDLGPKDQGYIKPLFSEGRMTARGHHCWGVWSI